MRIIERPDRSPGLLVTSRGLVYTPQPLQTSENTQGVEVGELMEFPKCQSCAVGDLVPLSDFGSQGAPIHWKAWVCTNPPCGFNIKIRNGDVYLNEPIASGAAAASRFR